MIRHFFFAVLAVCATAAAAGELETGFANPPRDARIRAYWWWLNGFVDKAAITRDLEEMKAKGFGGALICDADGSSQDGNVRAPHGPTFFTPEWRELFKHTLREADRLGLEMSLNIQSGWNLGGPMVTPDHAAKKIVWSETRIQGPAKHAAALPAPSSREGYYRDTFVVAYRLKAGEPAGAGHLARFTANVEQSGHGLEAATDGNPETFWVGGGGKPGEGPSRQKPVWVQFDFAEPTEIEQLTLTPRPNYGANECELQASDDGKKFTVLKAFKASKDAPVTVKIEPRSAKFFRVAIFSSFDPRYPASPRNVQIAEIELRGKSGVFPGKQSKRPTLQNWQEKAAHRTLHFSAPETTPLLVDAPETPGEEETRSQDVVELTDRLAADGTLNWDVPAGNWQVLRFGCTLSDRAHVSTSSEGWQGYAIDPLNQEAFCTYWDAIVEPLIADAGPLAGEALKYLHTDSWEIEPYNWTPGMREEFRKRRGYDLVKWSPALTGRIVESRDASNRFLHDFRRTLGDLAIDHHYKLYKERAHRHNLAIHPESGGPHAVPIDAQQCLGHNDVPMSEFWAWSWRHRVGDPNRFFVKQPASAAHVYGRRIVAAEGFTTIGPHWQETLWNNLKPSFDKACCEGFNLLFWHAFVCSPAEAGVPGVQYFAGTHFNPNTTWWPKSGPFLAYMNRCQFLLQRGLFAADVCYYYGDHVPNFAQLKARDPAGVLPGYDYDVITEEAILDRASVKNGRIVMPDGMSYRLLVLRDHSAISLPVLRKIAKLVDAGATVIGPKPTRATALADAAAADAEVRQIAARLWDSGKIAAGKNTRDVLASLGVKPDFEFAGGDDKTDVDYIHRRDGDAEIYFVANRAPQPERLQCTFRVAGRTPELWDAATGQRRALSEFSEKDGRTTVPLWFSPCGSWFVVFRPGTEKPAAGKNFSEPKPLMEMAGPWEVRFDPKWGGPAQTTFEQLDDWSKRPEDGIRFYSGTAVYRKTFAFKPGRKGGRVLLDLGRVEQLAEVRLNGKSIGIVWAPPFAVDVTDALVPGENRLEVEVVNFWPNRIIGDQSLPEEKRFTRTNILKLTAKTELMPSGLLGPVRVMETD